MKTSYPKIDIYVDGEYRCSTTWSKTCKEAKVKFLVNCPATPARSTIPPEAVKCFFAKR